MKHQHKFNKVIAQGASAYYRKPNCPKTNAVVVKGTVFGCECQKMLMEPDDLNLYPTFVEFELVKE